MNHPYQWLCPLEALHNWIKHGLAQAWVGLALGNHNEVGQYINVCSIDFVSQPTNYLIRKSKQRSIFEYQKTRYSKHPRKTEFL